MIFGTYNRSMEKLKLVFAGTGDIGAEVLKALAQDERFSILEVITGSDKPGGRSLKLQPSPIKELALELNLPIGQPTTKSELNTKIAQLEPDLLLVVDYGMIIPQATLHLPKVGAINIHPSLLPKHRGPTPIQTTLLNGELKTGVSWIIMSAKMDAGPLIKQVEMVRTGQENYQELAEKLKRIAADHTGTVLAEYAMNKESKLQDEEMATYTKKISKADGWINFDQKTADEIERMCRAYSGWPGCYFYLDNKRIKTLSVRAIEQKMYSSSVSTSGGKLSIGAREGAVEIEQLHPESKKPMTADEFLRGVGASSAELKLEPKP